MTFSAGELFHIYNRGNNRQRIFFSDRNYWYFLAKFKKHILPYCNLLAWCLMPNHFHFMIHTDHRSIATKKFSGIERNILCEGFRNLLSSYTHGINKQKKRTGSLFQQNTKAKLIERYSNHYDLTCFRYVHQNPIKSDMVRRIEDWPYSSFHDYAGTRNERFCNKALAIELLSLNMESFYEDSYKLVTDMELDHIFL